MMAPRDWHLCYDIAYYAAMSILVGVCAGKFGLACGVLVLLLLAGVKLLGIWWDDKSSE